MMTDNSQAQSDFLQKVLFLWTAARTIEGDWYFHGKERLGLSSDKCMYDAPFIDYQFSGIIKDEICLPAQERVLSQLQELVYKKHRHNWLSILVGTFVLLHTYRLLITQQRDFAQLMAFENVKKSGVRLLPSSCGRFEELTCFVGEIHLYGIDQEHSHGCQGPSCTFSRHQRINSLQ